MRYTQIDSGENICTFLYSVIDSTVDLALTGLDNYAFFSLSQCFIKSNYETRWCRRTNERTNEN